MSIISRLRHHLLPLHHRAFSILSKEPLSAKAKTRAALSLLRSETNPEKILEICRAASLTPDTHLDRVAFSVAISKLSESKNYSYIHDFLSELRQSRPDLQNQRFAAHSIVLYGQANMLDHAIQAFKEFHSNNAPSVKVFNSLLFACVLAKNYNEAKRIFVDFPKIYKIEPDVDTYNMVAKAFCDAGNSESVYSLLAEMDRKEMQPNAAIFGTLLSGFYSEGKYEDARKALKTMKEKYFISAGTGIHNTMIQGLCKGKKSTEAKVLLEKMLKHGPKPNSVTFGHLILGFCKEGDLNEAKKLFKMMVTQGYPPDSHCYFTLVYFLCQGGDFDAALEYCKQSMESKWLPNFTTMKMLVNGIANGGKVDQAKELIGQIKEKFPASAEKWDEIEATLQVPQ